MTLDFLQDEMKNAMKAQDKVARDVVRGIIAAVKKTVIDERCDATEELIDKVLLKEKKTLQEQIDTCPSDRVELLEEYKAKMTILDKYCPQLLDDPEAIAHIICELLADADIPLLKSSRGAAMKVVMPHFKGKADMKVVNQVMGEILL